MVSGTQAKAATGCGLLLMVMGGALIPVIEALLRDAVRNAVVIDSDDEWKDAYTGLSNAYDAYAWNCTNLGAVLATGAKPRFSEVSVEMTYVEENWDLEWVGGCSDKDPDKCTKFKYKSWWNYYAQDDAADARMDLEVVGVNPVYLSAIADFGGTESNLFYGLSYVVVQNVWLIMDGVVATVRYQGVPTHLNAVAYVLMSSYGAFFPDYDAVANQWGTLGVFFGSSLAGVDPAITTWELVTNAADAIALEDAEELWSTTSAYSLVADAAYQATWLAALGGDADALAGCEAHFDSGTAATVLTWLAALVDKSNPYYFAAIMQGCLDPAAAAQVSEWDDLGYLQFANGTVTKALFGADSVLPLGAVDGLVVVPEFSAYAGVELTLNESGPSTGDFSLFVDPAYPPTGFSLANYMTYAVYLYDYLPKTLFLKGFVIGYMRDAATVAADPTAADAASLYLNADGTGQFNSGLFCRRTLRELLFGYHDQIFNLVPPELSTRALAYNGVLGFQYESLAAQAATDPAPPLTYGKHSGADDLDKISGYFLWRDATEMVDRADIPNKDSSEYSCATYALQGFDMYPSGFESCDIFIDTVVDPSAGESHTNRVPPFKEEDRVDSYTLWITEAFRHVTIEYDEDTEVRGIAARKYVLEPTQFYTADCGLEPDRCNADNARYRMDATPSYVVPMATAQGGAPVVVAFPALGLTEDIWRDPLMVCRTTTSRSTAYIVIEPLTGVFIAGHQRLQYTWSLNSGVLDSGIWWHVFDRTAATNGQLYWPQVWLDKNDKISPAQARKFRKFIYGTRTQALAWAIIIGALGLGLFGVGCYGLRRRRQGRAG
ncbi:hypothetical protein JL722_5636 [Aureococcus anophagefferens]|nr:hypothetical protein JL722_5636 [Aureococcus anophagefferens]